MPLTVAVTGPTGDIGRSFLRALDAHKDVGRVLGMARRPFDPGGLGLSDKVEYRQGDILDPEALDDLFSAADVAVHLAFIIVGGKEETRRINLEGSRNVFDAAKQCDRLVYTSSVAAYGFHSDNPLPLSEDVPTRGSDEHYYSAQKAELEDAVDHPNAYVFRPCIVAGGDALFMLEMLPGLVRQLPTAVVPDPGVRFQLVHTDDVARALLAATLGRGEPGVYNLAGDGDLSVSDFASALGWQAVPIPKAAAGFTAALISRVPLLPAEAYWINAFRTSVVMDTTRAKTKLRWQPKHSSRATLMQTVRAAKKKGLV